MSIRFGACKMRRLNRALVFVSIEKIYRYNTRDSVSSAIQKPPISSKILRCPSCFQLSSRCLDIAMKHCLSCLIYYVNHELETFWVNVFKTRQPCFGSFTTYCRYTVYWSGLLGQDGWILVKFIFFTFRDMQQKRPLSSHLEQTTEMWNY